MRALTIILLFVASACGSSLRPVAPGVPLQPGPDDAIVIVGLSSPTLLRSMEMRRHEDMVTALVVAAPSEEQTFHVFVAPAGHYCLIRVQGVGINYNIYLPESPDRCPAVAAGQVTYLGHLEIIERAQRPFQWTTDEAGLCRELRAQRPELASRVRSPYGHEVCPSASGNASQ